MADDDQYPGTSLTEYFDRSGTESPYYLVDVRRRLVYVRFGRALTAATIRQYAQALRADPAFDEDFSEIIDTRSVQEVTIKPEEAVALADSVDPFSLQSRRAFVTCQLAQINAARMHQILRSPSKTIGIFQSMEEAEVWISDESSQAGCGTSGKKARILPFLPRPW